MYKLVFTATADSQLEKLDKPVKERIIRSLERIRFIPEPHLKKLVGEPGYRFRVGDYRVIVDLIKDELVILIIKIGHRKSVYD